MNLIRRGINNGELFSLRYKPNSYDPYEIYYSENFGDEFLIKNELNIINYYSYDIEGGTEEGEFFLLYNFVNLMWQNAHIYIYHSTDYGVTFEVFHPFSKGNEPVLSNFSTIIQEGEQPLEVEFCNYSIGEVSEYQWDFENDGTIDSYEQSPIHIYPDTGYYSVRLTIIGTDSSNTFLREDYIHVKKLTGLNNSLSNSKFTCYPNPFTEKVKITYNSNGKPSNNLIMIYNNTGKLIKTIIPVNKKITNKNHVIWDGTDENGDKCNAGFYYVNLNMKNSPAKKILLIN